MEYKGLSVEVKDLNHSKGVIEAYASVYNVLDDHKDIMLPSAFKKTVKEQRKRIRVFKDHNKLITLGVPLEVDAEDSVGLRTVTQFNMEKAVSKDMFSDIKLAQENGLNAELSVGYWGSIRDPKDKRRIMEVKHLGEYSFLSHWGANRFSQVFSVKSLNQHSDILTLIEQAYNLDYSDERLRKIEIILKSLTTGPTEEDTRDDEPTQEEQLKNVLIHNSLQEWRLKNF